MAKPKGSKGLGRGLSALLSDTPDLSAPAQTRDREIPMDLLHPNPGQPRKEFNFKDLEDLTASIQEKGVLQPLIVRPHPDKDAEWQIVAGERRWRAAQKAGLHKLPVIIRNLTDTEVLEIAIIENVQRADLNPIEEAAGYAALMSTFGHTQDAVAQALGKSRSYIANALRLLTLPEDVKDHLSAGRLTTGHARALITAEDASPLARRIIAENLTVRDVETLVRAQKIGNAPAKKPAALARKDADTVALQNDLSAAIGLKVSITHRASGAGALTIKYDSLDDLDGLCQLLNSKMQT